VPRAWSEPPSRGLGRCGYTFPFLTTPFRTREALEAPHSVPGGEGASDELPEEILAAFREVHARSLYGFALLFTLGDRGRAARLVDRALADAVGRLDELRHPERAAAWLRRRVVRGPRMRIGPSRSRRSGEPLVELGADQAVMGALASLTGLERAAVIASDVERLDRRDVATVVGRDGSALERLVRRGRARYLRAHATVAEGDVPEGQTTARVKAIARRQVT
jgi:hypothetical protein